MSPSLTGSLLLIPCLPVSQKINKLIFFKQTDCGDYSPLFLLKKKKRNIQHQQSIELILVCLYKQVVRDWKNGIIYFYPCKMIMIVPKKALCSGTVQSYWIDFSWKTSLERPFVSIISPWPVVTWNKHCILLKWMRTFEEFNLGHELSVSLLFYNKLTGWFIMGTDQNSISWFCLHPLS